MPFDSRGSAGPAGAQGPQGATGAAGADGEVSVTTQIVTCTGDLDAGTGNEDFPLTIPAAGLIARATLTRTAGTSTNLGAVLYNGDPAGAGVPIGALFGSTFLAGGGYDLSAGPKQGPLVNSSGADIPIPVPYNTATPYVRLTNRDFGVGATGRSSLTIKVIAVD